MSGYNDPEDPYDRMIQLAKAFIVVVLILLIMTAREHSIQLQKIEHRLSAIESRYVMVAPPST